MKRFALSLSALAATLAWGPAKADQTAHSVSADGNMVSVSWVGLKGGEQSLSFSLDDTLGDPFLPPVGMAHREGMSFVKDIKDSLPQGAQLMVSKDHTGAVTFDVAGELDVSVRQKALNEVYAGYQNAFSSYMEAKGFVQDPRGNWGPNYDAIIDQYAEELQPLAASLAEGHARPVAYIQNVLAFVQSIPFELDGDGMDVGFRTPDSVLSSNAGDCDSKSVLFAALVKAYLPDAPMALLFEPDHMAVAMAVPGGKGANFNLQGKPWTVVEPVGPTLLPMGDRGNRAGGTDWMLMMVN